MELWDLLGTSVTMIALPLGAAAALHLAARSRAEPWRTLTLAGWLVASGLLAFAVAGSPGGDDGATCRATMTEMRTSGTPGCTDAARTRFTVAAVGYAAMTVGGVLLLRRRPRRNDDEGLNTPPGAGTATMRNYFQNK